MYLIFIQKHAYAARCNLENFQENVKNYLNARLNNNAFKQNFLFCLEIIYASKIKFHSFISNKDIP